MKYCLVRPNVVYCREKSVQNHWCVHFGPSAILSSMLYYHHLSGHYKNSKNSIVYIMMIQMQHFRWKFWPYDLWINFDLKLVMWQLPLTLILNWPNLVRSINVWPRHGDVDGRKIEFLQTRGDFGTRSWVKWLPLFIKQ